MDNVQIILGGLIYISSFLFTISAITVLLVMLKTVCNIAKCCRHRCDGCESLQSSNIARHKANAKKSNKPNGQPSGFPESDEARKLRIELENIDAFYTGRAQKEVE